ncbi:hypothetical protein VB636_07495, partial [Paracoccus sp. APAP_BH8]
MQQGNNPPLGGSTNGTHRPTLHYFKWSFIVTVLSGHRPGVCGFKLCRKVQDCRLVIKLRR